MTRVGIAGWTRWGIRLLLLAVAGGYLAFGVVSHHVPLSPDLEIPAALVGWLSTAVFGVSSSIRWKRSGLTTSALRKQSLANLRRRRDIWAFGAAMCIVLAAAVTVTARGNGGGTCTAQDWNACIKADHWAQKDGLYYREDPGDAAHASDPNAPWAQISSGEYIAEVGTRLRSAAGFGIFALTLGTFVFLVEDAASDPRFRRQEPDLEDEVPQLS